MNDVPVIGLAIPEPDVPDFIMLNHGDQENFGMGEALGLYVNLEKLPDELKAVLLDEWRTHMP